jgi:predicted nucleotide-binding protein (sugar kinase/HSP70/actin superfamily)
MRFPTWASRSARKRSGPAPDRSGLRVGIPKALSFWSTQRFWIGFLVELGVAPRNIVFSSDTSEAQYREFGKGRGTVDSCYPVKCLSGHYGELLFDPRKKVDVLLAPLVATLPSPLRGHVLNTYACPREIAVTENIKAGFLREEDVFAKQGVVLAQPFVCLDDPELAARQLYEGLREPLGLRLDETRAATRAGYAAMERFDARMRAMSREILERCAREEQPAMLVLARPYHLDPGLGHEIDLQLQAEGFPILWSHYLPIDGDLLDWLFGEEVRAGVIAHPLDISDVWVASYSNSTNEILWAAKFATRCPWIACVVRLSSYECGMDQPTMMPVQEIVERSGTLFFRFGELDANRPAGTIRLRVETISYYTRQSAAAIVRRKRAALPGRCPLLAPAA